MPGTAEAALESHSQSWCKQKGAADQVLLDGGFASLIFKADDDLVLQPANHLACTVCPAASRRISASAHRRSTS